MHLLFHVTRRFLLPAFLVLRLVLFFSDVPLVLAASTPVEAQTVVTQRFSAQDLLAETNQARESVGVADLRLNKQLTAAAEAKAEDMAAKGYWDHFRPGDHKAPWDFITEAGYQYSVAGENLARGFQTPRGVVSAWLRSPAHAANLLSSRYTDVGFASITVSTGTGPVVLTVQMFGAQ